MECNYVEKRADELVTGDVIILGSGQRRFEVLTVMDGYTCVGIDLINMVLNCVVYRVFDNDEAVLTMEVQA